MDIHREWLAESLMVTGLSCGLWFGCSWANGGDPKGRRMSGMVVVVWEAERMGVSGVCEEVEVEVGRV